LMLSLLSRLLRGLLMLSLLSGLLGGLLMRTRFRLLSWLLSRLRVLLLLCLLRLLLCVLWRLLVRLCRRARLLCGWPRLFWLTLLLFRLLFLRLVLRVRRDNRAKTQKQANGASNSKNVHIVVSLKVAGGYARRRPARHTPAAAGPGPQFHPMVGRTPQPIPMEAAASYFRVS